MQIGRQGLRCHHGMAQCESVSRRSRGNAGRLEASHTAPYVFFRGAKVVSCALERTVCQYCNSASSSAQAQIDG